MSTEDQTNVKKVSEEQLTILRDLQKHFDHLTKRFGELHFQEKLVKQEKDEVDQALDSLELNRRNTVFALQEQFGSTGTVDLSTGEFIPD
jgi:hypothetical protein